MSEPVEPIELCLESLDAVEDEQPYVRCVALSGAELGLGLTASGEIVWKQNDAPSASIWVSADNQLMVVRNEESTAIRLVRAERFLDLPLAKPVVVLHEDLLEMHGHSFRLHIHGVAASVEPPTRLALRRVHSMIAGAALAAVSMAGCVNGPPDTSSAPSTLTAAVTNTSGGSPSIATLVASGGAASSMTEVSTQGGLTAVTSSTRKISTRAPVKPIEVRHHPPKPNPNPIL